MPYELKLFEKDTVLKDKRERWHKSLASDVYVEEALNVLQDLKINNIRKSKIAAIQDFFLSSLYYNDYNNSLLVKIKVRNPENELFYS